jgi:hypothetical protein
LFYLLTFCWMGKVMDAFYFICVIWSPTDFYSVWHVASNVPFNKFSFFLWCPYSFTSYSLPALFHQTTQHNGGSEKINYGPPWLIAMDSTEYVGTHNGQRLSGDYRIIKYTKRQFVDNLFVASRQPPHHTNIISGH